MRLRIKRRKTQQQNKREEKLIVEQIFHGDSSVETIGAKPDWGVMAVISGQSRALLAGNIIRGQIAFCRNVKRYRITDLRLMRCR